MHEEGSLRQKKGLRIGRLHDIENDEPLLYANVEMSNHINVCVRRHTTKNLSRIY